MSRICETLPAFICKDTEICAVLNAIGLELDRLENAARLYCRRTSVSSADEEGLLIWERELGLFARADLSAERRRAAVLAALDFFTPCTLNKLYALLHRMTEGEIRITENAAEGTISAELNTEKQVPPDLFGVQTALRRLTPAHLSPSLCAHSVMDGSCAVQRFLSGSIKLIFNA